MPLAANKNICVLQSAKVWLPQTQTWMYHQVRNLPDWVDNHVVCEGTDNLRQFELPQLHAQSERTAIYRSWDKLLRGVGLRHCLGSLSKVARQVDADILHSHFGHLGWMDMHAAERLGIPQVVTFYGQDLSYLPQAQPQWRQRYRQMFASVARVLCEGPHMASCIAELGCPEEKLQVQRLGVDLEKIPFKARTWDGNSPLRVLLAGSFTEKKGFPDAIAALGRIKDQTQLAITIIGDANAEPRNQAEKQNILRALQEQGLQEHVQLLGYQDHASLMQQAFTHHIFLSPSVHAGDGDTEGGAPVTILEMAASGMPVVSTTHCDIPHAICHPHGGLLAAEHDVEGLTTHLQTLLQEPQAWDTMGQTARAHISEHFDLRQQGKALGQIYADVLAAAL